jgi:Tol biopolymer transport system component
MLDRLDTSRRGDESWKFAYEIFERAQELPATERRVFAQSAGCEAEVLRIVLKLMDGEEQETHEQDLEEGRSRRAGDRVGHYEIVARLGEGGMGCVYSARDADLGRMVALKLLAPDVAATPAAAERLVREAKAASALNHPQIVTVYEVIRAGAEVAIAMELVEGEALRRYCGEPQPVLRVTQWGRQIAEALAAAHACGIVHRDIKPENLMVRADGYVKVLDFGLARQTIPGAGAGQTNVSGILGGTLNYMSPEQTRGERATSASDVFTLGMVLWELATGVHPFAADSPIDTAHAIAHDVPRTGGLQKAGLPPELAVPVKAMLAKDPRERPTAGEVERLLAGIRAVRQPKPRRAVWRARIWISAACLLLSLPCGWALWGVRERIFAPKEPVMRQITQQVSENRVTAAALSPDGGSLAFAGFEEPVQVRQMGDGVTRAIATPEGLQVSRMVWFADGSKLLVSGVSNGASNVGERLGIWLMPVNGGKPALVMPDGRDAAPSPDGTRIAMINGDGSTIWIAGLNGGMPRQIRGGGYTGTFSALVWSPDSRRISYQRQEHVPQRDRQPTRPEWQPLEGSYAYSYESADADTGRVVASVKDVVMSSACALPDGSMLYLRWGSLEDIGSIQLWELATDPRTGTVLRAPRRLTHRDGQRLSSISAANDGKRAVAILSTSQPNVYMADLPRGAAISKLLNIRRLTYSLGADYPHAWTPDRRAVIFESSRNGNFELFRQNIARREAEPLVIPPAGVDKVLASVSPDGKWVLYREDRGNGRRMLMRAPIEGGRPETVSADGEVDEFRCGMRPAARCVLRKVENDQFVFYELDPLRGKGRVLARTVWSPTVVGDWDLSPDGLLVAIPNHDPHDAKIRVVALEGSRLEMAERTIPLPGVKQLNGVVWAAGGQGWFVAAVTQMGSLFLYADWQGHTRVLLNSVGTNLGATYAVPSPDGLHVAFPQHTVASNVWAIETP